MKKYDFTKEEISFIIDRLKEVCSKPGIMLENFSAAESTFWCDNICNKTEYSSCASCMEFRLKTFLDIVKDVFANNVPPVQTEPKEKKLHKYRLFSTCGGETLDWIEITDEQIHLLKYLQSKDLLGDDINFEECEITNFKRI